ncbi:hypothetical protein P4O66_003258 [Electrophorus voltai]|uniref:DUF4704 domain-containing protein n=1 Tax=Electrophorus voltai TaxID=2609070 RepID=A0AAD8YT85_9TELE|nr:hypothetical protein P4O66_003258 [Electrophorus voltai]
MDEEEDEEEEERLRKICTVCLFCAFLVTPFSLHLGHAAVQPEKKKFSLKLPFCRERFALAGVRLQRTGAVLSLVDGPRPSQKEIISLRAFMLLFLKQLILKDRGVKEDELQSIQNYLLTMHEDENLHDVLQLLVALMSEHPASMVPAFDQRNGIRVVYKLLASKSESIRVQALKVLGYFLKHLGHKRKVEIMHTHSLFTLLGERLMLHTNTLSVTTYNTLYEVAYLSIRSATLHILTEQVCTQVVHKPHPEPDSSVKIQNPMILKVVATLLKNSTPSAELMEVRRLFLSDMIKLFSNSRENRRCLLQCSVWQDWMFSLGYINPKNPEEQRITEMVYNIFRILLYHAIKYEWGGWRVWVDTLSIAHSKVTYEAHKEYLAKMYEEYQRQEEENIKKGRKGQVSTISGLSAQTSAIKGSLELDDQSQTQSPESEAGDPETADPGRDILTEAQAEKAAPGVGVEVHDLLVDIKAEKVEATEVKLEDMDLSPEPPLGTAGGGGLVGVDSLLDNVYSVAVENLNGSVNDVLVPDLEQKSVGPLITLAEDKDIRPAAGSFLFAGSAAPADLLPEMAASEPLPLPGVRPRVHTGTADLGLLPRPAGASEADSGSTALEDCFELRSTPGPFGSPPQGDGTSKSPEQAEATARDVEASGVVRNGAHVAGAASDTERSDEGKEKEVKKILTTATTQGGWACTSCQSNVSPRLQGFPGRGGGPVDRDVRLDLGFRATLVSEEQRHQFSPGPRTTMFRIPEFKWSPMHQRLLTDLLVALEADAHVWRSHSTKSVMDFVNSNENIIFVHNTVHLISQMVDNIIIACGGVLPLLSAATSPSTPAAVQVSALWWLALSIPLCCFGLPLCSGERKRAKELSALVSESHSDGNFQSFNQSHGTTAAELEEMEVTQGMSSETAVTFLTRLMSMVDVLVFASSLSFSEIEAEKNMSSGGLMRQCLRLGLLASGPSEAVSKAAWLLAGTRSVTLLVKVTFTGRQGLVRVMRTLCCAAVRSCLECRQRQRNRGLKCCLSSAKTPDSLQGVAAASKASMENFPGNLSPIKDPDRLLQDADINRLRAVVFRDVDDGKQAQFLALAVVYFISVLMVSKYRDILEPQRETARAVSQSGRSVRQEINSPTSTENPLPFSDGRKETPPPGVEPLSEASLPHSDSGLGEEPTFGVLNGAEPDPCPGGPNGLRGLLCTLSSEVRSQESLAEGTPGTSVSSVGKGINVKEILKSLVASPLETTEGRPEPLPYPVHQAATREPHVLLPMQFHSFDRSVVVQAKKPGMAVNTVASSGSSTSGSTHNIFAAASATPKSMINTTGGADPASSSCSSSSGFVNGATSKNLPAVQTVGPMPEDSMENMSITTKLERALEKVAPLLREIFVDFAPFLSRTLLGSHGQELLIEGLVCMKSSTSVVELVMLLCSQEWQNSIQKNAGLAFIELINEGRLLCHAMKDHVVRVANEAEFILNRQRAEDVHKHAEFEVSNCAQYAADRREEEKMCDHLIGAAKHRDHVTANQLKQKIVNILTNKHGAWGALAHRDSASLAEQLVVSPAILLAGTASTCSEEQEGQVG